MKTLENISLHQDERKAIETAVEELKNKFPVDKLVLFGSKARGDSDQHSDIDLLIITPHTLHWKEEKTISDVLFEIGLQYDVIFSLLFVTKMEWEGGTFVQFPIYQDIMREGAVVS